MAQDALGLSDRLEELIDQKKDGPADRQAAYDAILGWKEKTAAYAFARGRLAGRLAETRGLRAVRLIADMERWSRISIALDPRFREGAARRMLGTLYVLAPASLLKFGDSEEGLEMLEKQLERHPDDPANHLRLAEGFIALGDPEPAYELLCFARVRGDSLRVSERHLLESLVRQVGGADEIECDEAP
jgi:tetratricopeptide (TPR) repeat protein